RATPIGAYFAGDAIGVADQARKSAVVTHAHAEGQAGAIAVALAAAWAAEHPGLRDSSRGNEMLAFVLKHTPDSGVRDGIGNAAGFAPHCSNQMAAAVLGNGSRVTAPDTVPFCLWVASRYLHEYEEAMWVTVDALGDRDTTCAIVGGIVALTCTDGVPAQ